MQLLRTGPIAMFSILMLVLLTSAVGAADDSRNHPGRGRDTAPLAGGTAPDFTLKILESEQLVTLSDAVKDGPVALVFGSYT